MRPIDADAVKDVIAELNENGYDISPSDLAFVRNILLRMPTIEPKKGKWETKFTPTECNPFGDYPVLIMRCSACKTKITLMHEDESIVEEWHYCPHCGAKMEGSAE